MDPVTASFAPYLLVYGPLGLMVLGLAFGLVRTRTESREDAKAMSVELATERAGRLADAKAAAAELAAERNARIEDAKATTELALGLQEKALKAIDRLAELAQPPGSRRRASAGDD